MLAAAAPGVDASQAPSTTAPVVAYSKCVDSVLNPKFKQIKLNF
jgi:hypothetical protein